MVTVDERVQALEDKLNILEDILYSLGKALKLGETPAADNWTGRPGGAISGQTLDDILFTVGSYLADKTLADRVALGRGTNCPPICPNPDNLMAVGSVSSRRVKKRPR